MDLNEIKLKNLEQNAIMKAFSQRDYKEMDKLFAMGVDVNEPILSFNGTLLEIVTTNYNDSNQMRKMIDYLLSKGANLKNDFYPLCIAARNGNIELMQKFTEHGADINNDTYSNALIEACENNQMGSVQFLIEKGANVNIRFRPGMRDDYETNRPLIEATITDNIEIIDYLIEKGAKVDDQVLLTAARNKGAAFKHFIFNHHAKVSPELMQRLNSYKCKDALEILDKQDFHKKLTLKLEPEPQRTLQKPKKAMQMKI